jgi:hypothetical protein
MDGPDSRTDKHSITLSHMDITGSHIWRTGIHLLSQSDRGQRRTALSHIETKSVDWSEIDC